MQIQQIKVSDLTNYENNSRTHSVEQVSQICASITEFGFNNPILIDSNNQIIAGHGRLQAAKKLELETVPCVELSNLSDAQKKAYVIADNQIALNSGWDLDMLKAEVNNLIELDFNVDLLGFDDDFLDGLLDVQTPEGLTDEDEVPEAPEKPVSVLGDIWQLGNHRLMCGDSTSIDAVDRLLDGQKADMVFTDPPYGMSYGGGRAAGSSKKGATVKAHGMIIGDELREEALVELIRESLSASVLNKKDGGAVYVCFPWRTYSDFEAGLIEAGLTIKACIVWNKKSIGLGNSNYRPQHEFIFYCGGQWFGDKAQSDVWSMGRDHGASYVHPTQKPVELIEKALQNSSKSEDVVHDCFGGSGSTLIACEKNNRHARLMELDEKYVDVIINRWQNFTSKQAVHIESGKTYEELKAESTNGKT